MGRSGGGDHSDGPAMGGSLERPMVSRQSYAIQHTVRELLPRSIGTPPVHYDTRRLQCVLCGNVPRQRGRLDLVTMTCNAVAACRDRGGVRDE
jgi:hypothetical protein